MWHAPRFPGWILGSPRDLRPDRLATLTFTDATVKHNFALGGAAGDGGSDGEGIGGGLYNLGAITDGSTYVIKKNRASTSNPDIYP